MYEDNERPALQRVLWIFLWFIVLVAIAWAIVWVAFFRNKSTTNTGQLHSQNPRTSIAGSGSSNSAPTGNASNSGSSNNTSAGSANSSGATSNQPNSSAGSSGGTAGSSSSASTTTSNTSSPIAPTTQPTNLANAGAGDVFVPFAAATLAGSTIYYIRLRKKLVQ